MKPCSAYCRPEEGVHVALGYVSPLLDLALVERSGPQTVEPGPLSICMEVGTVFRYVALNPAHEAPPSPFHDRPIPVLATVQVLS